MIYIKQRYGKALHRKYGYFLNKDGVFVDIKGNSTGIENDNYLTSQALHERIGEDVLDVVTYLSANGLFMYCDADALRLIEEFNLRHEINANEDIVGVDNVRDDKKDFRHWVIAHDVKPVDKSRKKYRKMLSERKERKRVRMLLAKRKENRGQ